MISINTPISQDEYIKLLEDFSNNSRNQSIKESKEQGQLIKSILNNSNKTSLFNLNINEWDLLISEIIKVNPYNNSDNNNLFGFNLLWKKLFISNKQYLNKDQFVNSFQKLYKDIENVLGGEDDKFEEKTSIEWLKKQLNELQIIGNNFNELLLLNNSNSNNNNNNKQILKQFNNLKKVLEQLLEFLSSKVYSSIFGNILTITMLIYSTLIRDGIKLGINEMYEVINGESNESIGLREILNKEILKFHKNIGNCCNKFCLAAIRPANSVIPWMNLPFNSQHIYGRINEFDLIQYPNQVERINNNEYGNGMVNCEPSNGVTTTTTFKVPPHYFNSSHASSHIDCVSGFNPIWESFINANDFININIIKNGGNDYINGYSIKLHLSSMYEGDSFCKVKIGENGPIHNVNLVKDLSNDLISFQVMNFKMLYNIDLPYGVKEFNSNNHHHEDHQQQQQQQHHDQPIHQKILNLKIYDVCNVVLNSIDITLE